MTGRHFEFRHIVDVDGQLIGVDAPVVTVADLLARAGRSAERRVFIVRGGARTLVEPHQPIALDENELLFVETVRASPMQPFRPLPFRLAA